MTERRSYVEAPEQDQGRKTDGMYTLQSLSGLGKQRGPGASEGSCRSMRLLHA